LPSLSGDPYSDRVANTSKLHEIGFNLIVDGCNNNWPPTKSQITPRDFISASFKVAREVGVGHCTVECIAREMDRPFGAATA
jgi:hypothetical protein